MLLLSFSLFCLLWLNLKPTNLEHQHSLSLRAQKDSKIITYYFILRIDLMYRLVNKVILADLVYLSNYYYVLCQMILNLTKRTRLVRPSTSI